MYTFCFGAEDGTGDASSVNSQGESSLLGQDPSPGSLVQQLVVVVQFLLKFVVNLKPMRDTGYK